MVHKEMIEICEICKCYGENAHSQHRRQFMISHFALITYHLCIPIGSYSILERFVGQIFDALG